MKPENLLEKYGGSSKSRGQRIIHSAKKIGVSRRSIYLWLQNGEIPYKTQCLIEFETGGALKAAKK